MIFLYGGFKTGQRQNLLNMLNRFLESVSKEYFVLREKHTCISSDTLHDTHDVHDVQTETFAKLEEHEERSRGEIPPSRLIVRYVSKCENARTHVASHPRRI